METPKPHPPVKKTEEVKQVVEEVEPPAVIKRPYVLKPHMSQRPFADNAALAALKQTTSTNKTVKKAFRNTKRSK